MLSMSGLLLQKVCTDCLGNFSRGLFVNPKVVELWKLLCFRSREDHCKLPHGQIYPYSIAFPPIYEKDVSSYFAVVFITTVKPSNFPMLAQIFWEETEHQIPFVGAEEEGKQQFHKPGRSVACALRASAK